VAVVKRHFCETGIGTTSAAVLKADIDGDSMQPGREGGSMPKAGKGSVGLEEHLIGDLLGPLMVAGHPEDELQDPLPVVRDENIEGGLIASTEPLYQSRTEVEERRGHCTLPLLTNARGAVRRWAPPLLLPE